MNKFEDYNASQVVPQYTLLKKFEKILEYLKANPNENVFYYDGTLTTGNLNISSLKGTTTNLAIGDLIIDNSVNYSYVATLGTGVFTVGTITSFKGDTGATGATGPQGEKGEKGDKGDAGASIPTTTTAGKVLKSTSTAGTVEWGDGGSETAWETAIKQYVVQNGTKTEVGGSMEVDGNITFNSRILSGDGVSITNENVSAVNGSFDYLSVSGDITGGDNLSVSEGHFDTIKLDEVDLQTTLNGKQATLVSGTNIKTVNNQSLLGSGNISIEASPTLYNHYLVLKFTDDEGEETQYYYYNLYIVNTSNTAFTEATLKTFIGNKHLPLNNSSSCGYGNGTYGKFYLYVDNNVLRLYNLEAGSDYDISLMSDNVF